MRLIILKNTTAFTTRSLRRVVARAFDRVGVSGVVEVRFVGQKRGVGGFSFNKGDAVEWPEAASDTGLGVVARVGRNVRFYVGPKMDAVRFCSQARWVGYGLRNVTGFERQRMYPATPADREFLADKPLITKASKRKRARAELSVAERARDDWAKKLARTRAAIAKNRMRARRLELALPKLLRREKHLAKVLVRTEGSA